VIYIGIDNGVSGALAQIGPDWVHITETPVVAGKGGGFDEPAMWALIQEIDQPAFAVIEGVAMFVPPGRPGGTFPKGVMSLYVCQALWRAFLTAKGIGYRIVRPRTWQPALMGQVDRSQIKARSIITAKQLYPQAKLRRSDKCRVDDHNFADALLLAEYARRVHGGVQCP